MSETFRFQITQTPEAAVEKARAAAEKEEALFEGDAQAGKFSALGVVGTYRIRGDVVEVELSERPFFAPLSIVESKIKSLFK
jgi:hypothetical protein